MRNVLEIASGWGFIALWLTWLPAAAGGPVPEPREGGVVISEVGKESALYVAGVRLGDRVVSWKGPTQESSDGNSPQGQIRSVFDWEWVKVEQAPRGGVELHGWRGIESKVFSVSPGSWHGKVRPPQLREAAEDLSCWLSFRAGDALAASGQLKEALSAYETALVEAEDPVARVVIWDAIGAVRQRLGESAAAREAYLAALEIRRLRWTDESLGVAKSRSDLGNLAWNGGDLKLAAEHHRRALDVRQAVAPDSLTVAESLKALGVVAGLSGDLQTSADYVSRALGVQQALAPGGRAAAESLNHLGILSGMSGRRALAEDYFSRSLEIRQALDPGSLGEAAVLINLGRVAWKRGDFDGAEHRYRGALAIQEKLAPGSENLATLLTNLGLLARDRGRFDVAEVYLQRALAIRENLGPESIFVADSLSSLGKMAIERGRLEIADRTLRRALAIQERVASGSLYQAESLFFLGKVAAQRSEIAIAEGYYSRALAIREALAAGSKEEAESLHALGQLYRESAPETAVRLFERATSSLEAQIGMLGGSEGVKSSFRARYRPLYQDLIDLLVELDRKAEAFNVLEKSRARSFLALLTERELLFSVDLPVDLETARRTLAVRYDRTLERLFRVSPHEGPRFEALSSRLAELRRERDHLIADIRHASRRFGELHYPQPLDLAGAREALDPGTVMLSYSVGRRFTHIFAVTRDSFDVATVELAEEDLREQIGLFRRLIRATGSATEIRSIRRSQLLSAGRQLFASLVLPVVDPVARSERVLIIPDGPIHVLPFRALILTPRHGSAVPADWLPEPRYLIEWKPLHSALSATVYGELRKAGGFRAEPGLDSNSVTSDSVASDPAARGPVRLTAFGDPLYPLGFENLTPLPHSRQEVERISALYPAAGVRAYLGEAATEEQAKSVGRETRILHFATHATLDDSFPLDSALALTIPEARVPGRENGLLQTFEIFERLRLNADLVVLSGCETALGQELAGEGLIGLTRAFQYAGARTVAASLWSVRDRATAELMVRFHRNLQNGLPKAEALRAAQVELIRRGGHNADELSRSDTAEVSSPFVWAAFELYGDWR